MTAVAELEDRIVKCQKILGTDPNSQIFAALAEALRKKGELDKAFRTCQSGLKIHPNYGPAHTVMAKINLDRGQYDWAEAELKRARELEGPSRASDLLMAEIYIYKGTFDEAISILKILLEGDPNSQHIRKLLDIAQRIPEEQRRIADAEKAASRAPEVEPLEHNQPLGSIAAEDQDTKAKKQATGSVKSVSLTAAEIVNEAAGVGGIIGSMFVNREGLAVEAKWNAEIDQELCAVTLSEVCKNLNTEVVQNSFGRVTWVLIETERETMQLVRRKEGTFIFVGAAKINLGPMRMKLTELFERYLD